MTRYRARKGKADRLQELRLEVVRDLHNLSFPFVVFHVQKDPIREIRGGQITANLSLVFEIEPRKGHDKGNNKK